VTRFNLLGTLEVLGASGRPVRIPRPRARQLLAVLLLHHGRPVPADFLVAAVWGEEAPSSMLGTLRTYLYLLRRDHEIADRLHRADGGYQLSLRPGELDLDDFRLLARRGQQALDHGDLPGAEHLLRRALDLWRLPEMLDVPATLVVMEETVKLSGQRVRASELLVDAVLRQGRHQEIVPVLDASVRLNPLNEHAWEQLIVALYGAGRRVEAIQAYHSARSLLVSEYGVEPGPRLRRVFQQVLRDDPALTAVSAPG
jgi:DNA-binding SARP family transcriptional activator